MGFVELFLLPAIMSLLILGTGTGAGLALAPQRMARTIGNGFGFDIDFKARRTAKALCVRGAGALLAAYGLYLLLHTTTLWHALLHMHP
ncbi:hypothetical protein [Streptacidiphilus sp. MAP12-16]|uniref:hypothetical protein n=1 Tax=Streptacidiphilus sp. MAP12-16 TaxID=3156300 RepID=UPI003514C862